MVPSISFPRTINYPVLQCARDPCRRRDGKQSAIVGEPPIDSILHSTKVVYEFVTASRSIGIHHCRGHIPGSCVGKRPFSLAQERRARRQAAGGVDLRRERGRRGLPSARVARRHRDLVPHAGGRADALKTAKRSRTTIASGWSPRSPTPSTPQVLEATREYGVYGDLLLTYYAKHILAKSNDELAAAGPSPELKLDVVPKATADGLELTVLWDGKPRADVDVSVKVDGENEDVEPQKFKTDADGKVTLKPEGAGPRRRCSPTSTTRPRAASSTARSTPAPPITRRSLSPGRQHESSSRASRVESQKKTVDNQSRHPAAARAGLQLRRRRRGRLPLRLQRPHRHRARPLGRESLAAFPPRAARRRQGVGSRCRCRRRCKVWRSWPTAASSTASAA